MPEIAGTMPAIKLRPKVAKQPTISAPRLPEKVTLVEKKPEPKLEPKQEPMPESIQHFSIAATIPEVKLRPKVAKRPTISAPRLPEKVTFVEKKPEPKQEPKPESIQHFSIAATIPEVKLRPKVAKRSSISAPKSSEKMPSVTKEAKAAAIAKPKLKWTFAWRPWHPIAAGIALAFIAPQIHALAAHWDPWGLRAVFPFVQLAGLREIGMSDELTRTVPQLMLYLQFPLEGLLVASNLRRGMPPIKAVGPIVPLHFVAGLVLWIVALGTVHP